MIRAYFDRYAFMEALDVIRQHTEKTWNQIAEECGVAASTLSRMRDGKNPDVDGLCRLLHWSKLDMKNYIHMDEEIPNHE